MSSNWASHNCVSFNSSSSSSSSSSFHKSATSTNDDHGCRVALNSTPHPHHLPLPSKTYINNSDHQVPAPNDPPPILPTPATDHTISSATDLFSIPVASHEMLVHVSAPNLDDDDDIEAPLLQPSAETVGSTNNDMTSRDTAWASCNYSSSDSSSFCPVESVAAGEQPIQPCDSHAISDNASRSHSADNDTKRYKTSCSEHASSVEQHASTTCDARHKRVSMDSSHLNGDGVPPQLPSLPQGSRTTTISRYASTFHHSGTLSFGEGQQLDSDPFGSNNCIDAKDASSVNLERNTQLNTTTASSVLPELPPGYTFRRCLSDYTCCMSIVIEAHDTDGNVVVMKKAKTAMQHKYIERELEILKLCEGHPHIVQLARPSLVGRWLVAECMGGSFEGECEVPQNLALHEVAKIAEVTSSALAFLHERNILHRDVKPHNIFFERSERSEIVSIKLADMGLAIQLADHGQTATGAGTRLYEAPEVRQNEMTFASDMWSWACTIAHLATGVRPFHGDDRNVPYSTELRDLEFPSEFLNLLEVCLRPDPTHRPLAHAARECCSWWLRQLPQYADEDNANTLDTAVRVWQPRDTDIKALERAIKQGDREVLDLVTIVPDKLFGEENSRFQCQTFSISMENATEIGSFFLCGCTSLQSLDLSFQQVTTIGDAFLALCIKLTALDLTKLGNTTNIGDGFLHLCWSLDSLDLSPMTNLTSVGDFFLSRSGLSSLNLGSLVCVGDFFLAGCHNLSSLALPPLMSRRRLRPGVKFLGHAFLAHCSGLTSLDVSPLSHLTHIGNGFLCGCKGLTALDLSPLVHLTHVRDRFLGECEMLSVLHLPPNLCYIGDDFLHGCVNLKGLDFSEAPNVSRIGTGFLGGCTGLDLLDLSSLSGKIQNSITGQKHRLRQAKMAIISLIGVTLTVSVVAYASYTAGSEIDHFVSSGAGVTVGSIAAAILIGNLFVMFLLHRLLGSLTRLLFSPLTTTRINDIHKSFLWASTCAVFTGTILFTYFGVRVHQIEELNAAPTLNLTCNTITEWKETSAIPNLTMPSQVHVANATLFHVVDRNIHFTANGSISYILMATKSPLICNTLPVGIANKPGYLQGVTMLALSVPENFNVNSFK